MRALALLTAVGLSATSLAWRDYTHAALTLFSLQHVGGGFSVPILDRNLFKTDTIYPLRMNSMMQSSTLLTAFAEGSISQDCDVLSFASICLNHFYNPIDNSGLNDIAPGFVTQNSMSWAYNGYANSDTWVNARQRYYEALTASSPSQRKAAAQEMFYDLGNVAHLIQDLTQPQHSRNDAHMDESSGGYGIEHFADREYGTLSAMKAVYTPSPTGLPNPPIAIWPTGSLVVHQIDPSIPEEFQWLWDTEDYVGQSNFISSRTGASYPQPVANGLAEVVNFHFVTTDTVFSSAHVLKLSDGRKIPHFQWYWFDQGLHFDAQRVFMHPTAEEWGVPDLASQLWPSDIRSSVGQGWALESQPTMEVKSPLVTPNGGYASVSMSWRNSLGGFKQGQFFFRESDYRNICKAVLPYAIDYTAYMVGMFFRGGLAIRALSTANESATHSLLVGNITGSFSNPLYSVLGSGKWEIYQTNNDGTRSNRKIVENSYAGNLAYDGALTAKFFPKPWLGRDFVVVFRGKIGTEDDAITASAFKLSPKYFLEGNADDGQSQAAVSATDTSVWASYQGPDIGGLSVYLTSPRFDSGTAWAQKLSQSILDRRSGSRPATGKLTVYAADATDNTGPYMGSDLIRFNFQGVYTDAQGGPCNWSKELTQSAHGFVKPRCSLD